MASTSSRPPNWRDQRNGPATIRDSDRGGQVTASGFPLGARVTLDELDRNPYPILAELREHEPVGEDRGLLATLAERGNLSEDEITSNALIIMFGGIETTEAMICNTVWALLQQPGAWARVGADRTLLGAALDEALRWEPSVQSCTRHLTRDATVCGVELTTGATVQCMLGAANRDPAHFEAPDTFDIDRPNRRDHLSFGAGRHYCLGAPLAYLETECALTALLDRYPDLVLDADRPAHPRGYEFRKPPELWVRWDSRT